MGIPFLDTRDVKRLQLVCNLLTYRHEFCCKESNIALLVDATKDQPGAHKLIEVIRVVQTKLRDHLPLKGIDKAWEYREEVIQFIDISTSPLDPNLSPILNDQLRENLDTRVLEGALAIKSNIPNGYLCPDALRLACICVWLSDLLALLILGIARAEYDQAGTLLLKPASDDMRRYLRRLWFAVAFEAVSLANASLNVLRYVKAVTEPAYRSDLQEARLMALTIFPQHWRLPVDSGPIGDVLFSHLEPLLLLLIHSVAAQNNPGKLTKFGPQQAKQNDIEKVFKDVVTMQSALPIVDRLFNVENGCLTLGTRSLACGAIEIAEYLTASALGKDWHGTKTSVAQKNYIMERLGRIPNVEVLDFELRQHDTENQIGLDVDFFVRDAERQKLYGVQLKHLESNFRGGILDWVSRFRDRTSGLGNLVRQLENLCEVARSDVRARQHLVTNGISPEECERVIPIGLHNVGTVDFFEVQNGVILYDIHTFANVLAGRVGIAHGAVNGTIFTAEVGLSSECGLGPDNPDAVMDAYLGDPQFAFLSHFDAAMNVRRQVQVNEMTVIAEGLGV